MRPDLVLADLQIAWATEDQLRPDAPAGPRHSDRTYDLTAASTAHQLDAARVQVALWTFFRGLARA